MTEPRDFRRILLIRRKALGDALVSMRAVLEVQRAWPRADIDLVIDRPFAPLLSDLAATTAGGGHLRVMSWPPPPGTSWWGMLRAGGYDLVIDWLGSPRTAAWTMLTMAPVRVGYDLPRRRWAYNVKVPRNRSGDVSLRGFAGEAFLDPLRALGVEPPPWRDGFASGGDPVKEATAASAEFDAWLAGWLGRPGPPVVMMLSATWSAKAWPDDHAAALYERLGSAGFNPLVATGPADDRIEEALRGRLPAEAFAPPTTLPELARVVGAAAAFVGTDCGPRHLAASLGVPTVTLFGPTDPVGWNPATPRHVSVRTGVDCSPCDLADCPVAGHPCMTGILPAMVLEAVTRLLGNPLNGKGSS